MEKPLRNEEYIVMLDFLHEQRDELIDPHFLFVNTEGALAIHKNQRFCIIGFPITFHVHLFPCKNRDIFPLKKMKVEVVS